MGRPLCGFSWSLRRRLKRSEPFAEPRLAELPGHERIPEDPTEVDQKARLSRNPRDLVADKRASLC